MFDVNALHTVLLLLISTGFATAGDPPAKERTLLTIKGNQVQRKEVTSTETGLTSTSVFYTFEDERVVVSIHIDNARNGFPVTGKVCRFANDVSSEDMAKWVNNQHSCARFADAPKPEESVTLPAGTCRLLTSDVVGQRTMTDITYRKYLVEIGVAEFDVGDRYRLLGFRDKANVYVEAK